MKVLVTGGAGFIGSHVVDALIKNNYDVAVVDNLSNGKKENINPKVKFYKADILGDLSDIFKEGKFDAVIHNAALIDVIESKSKPELYKRVNVQGTMNVLECCRRFNVNKFVYASSGGAIYGNPEYLPCDEEHPKNPVNPYGKTKLEAENRIVEHSERHGMDYTILRFSNVYGPRQDLIKGGVIAKFIGMIQSDKRPIIFGDGKQTRDFIFAEDAALANVCALKAKNMVFNIGFGSPTSINELYSKIKELFNASDAVNSDAVSEVKHTYLDIGLARDKMGWGPKVSLVSGLKKTL